jgi:hypothetical protein
MRGHRVAGFTGDVLRTKACSPNLQLNPLGNQGEQNILQALGGQSAGIGVDQQISVRF